MALFKISKGSKANLPVVLTEGFCWYTYDDSKFYIDHKDENGVLVRKALNAQDAETLTGASLATILNASDVEIPTSAAVLSAIDVVKSDMSNMAAVVLAEAQADASNKAAVILAEVQQSIAAEQSRAERAEAALGNRIDALNVSGGGTSIIDVVELPADGIDDGATYRLLRGSFFLKNMKDGASSCYVVDEIPEEGESVLIYTDYGFGFIGYYNKTDDTVYGYFNSQTKEDLKDYVNSLEINDILRITLLGIINTMSTGWKTMEDVVNTLGTALSMSWGGIVTNTADIVDEDTLYLYLSSDLFSYQNNNWVCATNEGVGRVGQGLGSEIFNNPYNVALGTASHAEGHYTAAIGNAAHSEGYETVSEGRNSHAEGDGSQAIGWVSHAEGFHTVAEGHYSHSGGYETQALGLGSFTSGMGTIANAEGQHAIGTYNVEDPNAVFIVGNGTKAGPNGAETRKNAFVVKKDGEAQFNGTVTVSGKTTTQGTVQMNGGAMVIGSLAIAKRLNGGVPMEISTAATQQDLTNTVDNAFKTKYIQTGIKSGATAGVRATAEGYDNTVTGTDSHAEGRGVQAIGECAHAEGIDTVAEGATAHAEGHSCQAIGLFSHAEGHSTTAEGPYSHTEGSQTITFAEAGWAHAEGAETIAAANLTHAEGYGTVAASPCQHTQGCFNIPDEDGQYLHIVGNGEDDENRSNAHTVDWEGNGWFKGEIKIGGESQDDESAQIVATQEFVNSEINSVNNVLFQILTAIQTGGTTADTINTIEQLLITYLEDKTVGEVEG